MKRITKMLYPAATSKGNLTQQHPSNEIKGYLARGTYPVGVSVVAITLTPYLIGKV